MQRTGESEQIHRKRRKDQFPSLLTWRAPELRARTKNWPRTGWTSQQSESSCLHMGYYHECTQTLAQNIQTKTVVSVRGFQLEGASQSRDTRTTCTPRNTSGSEWEGLLLTMLSYLQVNPLLHRTMNEHFNFWVSTLN